MTGWFAQLMVVLALAILAAVLFLSISLRRRGSPEPSPRDTGWAYSPRQSFFTRSEAAFFHAALGVLPEDHHLFPKVRLSDLVEINQEGRDYWAAFGRISQKHVDFVLCDSSFRPYLAVEIDGTSHRKQKQRKSDATKDQVLRTAGLPLVRYKVGTDWDLSRITQHFS